MRATDILDILQAESGRLTVELERKIADKDVDIVTILADNPFLAGQLYAMSNVAMEVFILAENEREKRRRR